MTRFTAFRAARFAAALLAVTAFAQLSDAATKHFEGAGSGDDWGTDANWLPNGEPNSGDRATVLFGRTVEVTKSGESARGIDVSAGGSLHLLSGALSFQAEGFHLGDGSSGVVQHSGGTLIGSGPGSSLLIGSHGEYHMSGGLIDLDENLAIASGGVFSILGADAAVSVDGDWVFHLGSGSSSLQIKLVGDTVPQMHIAGDLHLNDSVILELDTGMWTGGPMVELFEVEDDILGDFSQVLVNGAVAGNVQIGSGSVSVEVPEPHTLVLLLLGLMMVAVCSGATLSR